MLATYGRQCWLKLAGCTKIATTKDHITPYAQGGTDDISNFRPACRSCNSKRQNRNYGGLVRIITGPPAAGKSTYVQDHAHPLDVVIDLDRIAAALMPLPPNAGGTPLTRGTPSPGTPSTPQRGYPPHVRHVAIGARQAAIQRATRLQERIGVWIIHSVPSPAQLEEYEQLGWQVISIDPGEQIVKQRIATQREAGMNEVADRWYKQQQTRNTKQQRVAAPARDWGI